MFAATAIDSSATTVAALQANLNWRPAKMDVNDLVYAGTGAADTTFPVSDVIAFYCDSTETATDVSLLSLLA
jgi:hypothetical protein